MKDRTIAAARRTYPALGIRNYRLYFFGHALSVSGTWMQAVALTWLVLKLTDDGLVLGLTAALQYLPLLVLGPLAGVIVDRTDKRRLLLGTQCAAATLALALSVLTLTGTIQTWMVLAFALSMGFVNAVDVPTRQTFAVEMVGTAHLANAITLNSVVMNAGRLVGPAVAGLTIATLGLGACFLVNAASYVSLIVALTLMDRTRLGGSAPVTREKGQLRAGLRYVWRTPAVRAPLVVMALIGTFTYEFQIMLPLHARHTFASDAGGYSVLMSAMGAGSVFAGLLVASRLRPSARRLGWAGLLLGALVLATALAPTLATTAVVLFAVGGASIAFMTLSNATLQLTATPEMRGRVVALYAVAFLGSIPIGAPIMGWLGSSLGARSALLIAGSVAVLTVAASWRALNRTSVELRPIPADAAECDRAPAAPHRSSPLPVRGRARHRFGRRVPRRRAGRSGAVAVPSLRGGRRGHRSSRRHRDLAPPAARRPPPARHDPAHLRGRRSRRLRRAPPGSGRAGRRPDGVARG